MVEPLYPLRCLLAQASQHLWLVDFDDVYREFTCVHHTIHPAPSPPDARRYTVPSRFRCQSGDCGYRVRRLCTGRYLPAHLRRILLMEQQVWSIQLARQSTLRPRVAATTKSGGMCPCLLPRMVAHGAPGPPDSTLEEDGGAPKRGRGVQQHATYSILFESFMVNTGDL